MGKSSNEDSNQSTGMACRSRKGQDLIEMAYLNPHHLLEEERGGGALDVCSGTACLMFMSHQLRCGQMTCDRFSQPATST